MASGHPCVWRVRSLGLILPLATLPEVAAWTPEPQRSECRRAYEEGWEQFYDVSGVWLHSHGRGDDPTFAWQHLLKDQGGMKEELQVLQEVGGVGSERAASVLFQAASSMILGCWGRDGRFWHAVMRNSQQAVPGSTTVCAPYVCSQEQVEAEIVPIFYGKVMSSSGDGVLAEVKAKELSHWADVDVDFVVIGVDGCGSTALRRGLGKHTGINFTSFSIYSGDEDFFLHEMGRQTLPYMSQVEAFASKRAAASKHPQPGLIGLYQAGIWREDMLLTVLHSIPHVKVLVTVCDPIDRFERLVYLHQQTHGTSFEGALSALLDPPGSLQEWERLFSWRHLLEDRIMFVERDTLSSRATFDAVADFLGLKPFGARSSFRQRYNSRGRRSSRFCENRTLIEQLKQGFEKSYQIVEWCLNHQASERLRQRMTRCEIQAELDVREECIKRRCSY